MKYLLALFLLIQVSKTHAQSGNSYLADLNELRHLIQKTPSYKDQIKGQALVSYNQLFESLKADSLHAVSDYEYFYNLARLFFPIKDSHTGFYQTRNNNLSDRAAFERSSETKEFINFPKVSINLDSLKTALATRPLDSIEGIYSLDTFHTVGLYRVKPREYMGVVLSSKITFYNLPYWLPGQVAIHLYEDFPNHFKAIYADPISKRLIYYANERFSNSSLVNSHFYGDLYELNYKKISGGKDFTNLPKNRAEFNFKTIEPDIQYLHLKHFSAETMAMQRSAAFCDSIRPLLTAPNLILDLRNNEGGAEKVSKPYLSLLKKYSKKGRIYVLANNRTVSRAEIFILQLKELDNVMVLGQTTNGMLTYGSNMGKTNKLPSQAFQVYLTDMDGSAKLLAYEDLGINPDIVLVNSKDWVEQTIEIIRKK
jgi:hypothetical protein